jgi:predicted lipid-binding transport protein (Tim44 family)
MRKIVIALAALLIGGAIVIGDAEAARLGGGRSLGAQRSIARTPPASAPAKPAQQAAPQQQPAPAQAAPQPQPQGGFLSRWGPLLGGLALGGLLGSLFGGSGLGGVLLLVLGALAVLMVVAALRRRGSQSQPVQFAGFNERAAVPAEQPAATGTAAAPRVPDGFDTATFLRGAKINFVKLQLANDSGDLEQIREFTTTEMFDALAGEIRGRAGAQQTDIASLDAELLDVASERDRHWASVRFSGVSREAPGAPAENFEEVWNLVKPADGSSGWLLAGIQQVH